MKVKIKSLATGAKEARGNVIIIDVLRATSTICTLIAGHVESILPLKSAEEALKIYNLRKGEWKFVSDDAALIDMGFYDNSPHLLSKMNLAGEKIVQITTNGTRGVVGCEKASEVLIGSFLNAKTLANYLKSHDELITLVPIGNLNKKALEDELCARYIKDILEGRIPDEEKIRQQVLDSEWAEALIKTGRADDVRHCVSFNKYNVIPVYTNGLIKHLDWWCNGRNPFCC